MAAGAVLHFNLLNAKLFSGVIRPQLANNPEKRRPTCRARRSSVGLLSAMSDVSGDGDRFRDPSELKFAEIGPSVRQPRRFHVTDYKGEQA